MTFSKYALQHSAKCPTLRVCRKTEGGCGTSYSSSIWGTKRKCDGCGHDLKWGFYDEDEYA